MTGRTRNDHGMTLIELSAVMLIMGVLGAIAVPSIQYERAKSVDSTMKADLEFVADEMEARYTQAQVFPDSFAATTSPLGLTLAQGDQASVTSPVTAARLGSYCIVVSRTAGASSGRAARWVYVSDKGGVQSAAVQACV